MRRKGFNDDSLLRAGATYQALLNQDVASRLEDITGSRIKLEPSDYPVELRSYPLGAMMVGFHLKSTSPWTVPQLTHVVVKSTTPSPWLTQIILVVAGVAPG